MSNIDDGGPAFPGETWGSKGMSLRDWFAGQIAEGLAAADDHRRYSEGCGVTLEEWRSKCDAEDAKYCYARADAMIAAREAARRDKQKERAETNSELSDAEIIAELFSHISKNGDELELFEEKTWACGRVWASLASEGGKRISSDAVDVICCGGLLTFRQGGVCELRSLYKTFFEDCSK